MSEPLTASERKHLGNLNERLKKPEPLTEEETRIWLALKKKDRGSVKPAMMFR